MRRMSGLVLAMVLLSGPARADLLITERTGGKAGGRTVEGVRSTYIKGTRMRIEVVQGEQSAATVFDLAAGTIANLDARKRRAELHDMAARNAKLEKEYPRARTTVSVTASGTAATVAATACETYAFVVRVPLSTDGKTAMTMTGTACLAGSSPGAENYRTFAQTARERDLVVGYINDNAVLLAIPRGQTELYRALSAMPGIPYLIDMTIGVDGKGMLASVTRKLLSGSRTTTVTSVAVEPLADTLFGVPDGWKQDKK